MAEDAQLLRLSRELFLAATAPPSIPTWAIQRMASVLEEQWIAAGDTLFSAGDPPDVIYFMQDGSVRTTRDGGAPLTFNGRWFLGGFNAVADRPHSRTAKALSTFRVQRLPADAWLELLEDSFEIARNMLDNASRTLAKLQDRFGAQPADEASATFFLPAPDGALNLVERLALLAEIPALRGSGIQTLADLATLGEEVAFEPGEAIWARGETPERAYAVFDGQVEASRESPQLVRRFGPGTLVLGTVSLVGLSPDWGALAKTRVRALSFRLEESMDLMEEHFDMVRSLLTSLGEERERLLDAMATRSGGLVLE